MIEYLGRYTHRIAITNHRILNINDTGVTFRWRDYRDNRIKIMSLEGSEFLRRFCQHILPRRFVRIRHYGLLSSTRREELRELQQMLGLQRVGVREKKYWKQACRDHLGFDPDLCPICGKGKMLTVENLPPGRSPPLVFHLLQNVSL